ncbi:MAG: hypothetical protein K8I02_07980, partial [Candidatus Methylomirabilis sp.]|nr:hypothetical protein [Deltaproteobacteria bacterium]
GRDHTTAMSSVRVVESARAAGEADRLRTDRAYTIFRVLEPEASAATPTVPTAKELRAALAEVQRARAALDRIEARLKELGAADAPEEVSHGT